MKPPEPPQEPPPGEESRRRENAHKAKEAADRLFPDEKWETASLVKLRNSGENFELPSEIDNISVAKSRLTGIKGDELILAKEIKQAKVLSDKGAVIYLIPKAKDIQGKSISGPDAVINGVLFEFKNITGGLDRVEVRFRQSRKQSENVYLKIDNLSISKSDIITRIRTTLNNKSYTGGTDGSLIVYLAQTKMVYFMEIKNLL